jgi:hypothetical protein
MKMFRAAMVCSAFCLALGLGTAHAQSDFRAGAIGIGPTTAPPDCDRSFNFPSAAAYTTGACSPAGITVFFNPPMPSTQYVVTVQEVNTAGYSPTSDCTYWNVLNRTTTSFQVQHKRCLDGVPESVDVSVNLNWMLAAFTQVCSGTVCK